MISDSMSDLHKHFAVWLTIVSGFATAAHGQDARELAVARAVFQQIQAMSFAEDREFCGYIGVLADGRYAATDVTRGRANSCRSRASERAFVAITASFHTHGSFTPNAEAEFPSAGDVDIDMREGVNGYIATPGGRLWYVDATYGEARQICGMGCLSQDPDFIPGMSGPVNQVYSLEQLERRERE